MRPTQAWNPANPLANPRNFATVHTLTLPVPYATIPCQSLYK